MHATSHRTDSRARTALLEMAIVIACVAIGVVLALPSMRAQGFPTIWTGGIAVALLVRISGRSFAFVAWFICVIGVGVALILSGFLLIEAIAGALLQGGLYAALTPLVRRHLPLRPTAPADAWRLIALSALAAAMQIVILLPLSWLTGHAQYESALQPVLGASISTFIGMLVFVPIVLLALDPDGAVRLSVRRRWVVPMWLALEVALVSAVFFAPDSADAWAGLSFLTVPLIVMFAAVAPPFWLATAVVWVAETAAVATALDHGPFAPSGDSAAAIFAATANVQLFLGTIPTSAWLLLAAVQKNRHDARELERRIAEQIATNEQLRAEAERREAVAQELRTVNERFGAAVMRSNVPMGFGPMTEELGDFNDAMCDFYGVTREQLVGARWTDFMDDAVAAENVLLQRKLATGEIDNFEVLQRIRTPQGMQKWGRVTATALRSSLDDSRDWAIAQIVDVTKEVEAQHALQRMVDEDPVTGLHSRTWMTQRLRELLRTNAGTGRRTGVIYVELAPYLVIYRAHGFEAGDQVLRQLGSRLQPILPAEALLGRFEGMTLLVILPEVTSQVAMEQLCVDILENVAQELEVAGRRISRTGNIGAAISHPHSTVVSLLQDADQALLRAEVGGRSRWHIVGWDDAVEEEPLEPVDLEHELREALDTGQFVMHYQPQVNLHDRSISGYEALVRWQQPTRGLIGPGAFMPLMESTGLIGRLGRQVLAMVCERIKATPDLAGPIAVNVSAIELDDSGWLENVIDTIRLSGIDPRLLVIELTETTVLDLTGRARESLQSLRDLGVGIHVDDFGTGYTSVATLLAMPCTAVKLDMSLSARLVEPTDSDISLIRAIATLAASLGLETIAEGIEHAAQAELLRDAGWHVGQGYLFGRPMPQPLT